MGTCLIYAGVGYFIVAYLHAEEDIYTWDSCVYWIKAISEEKNAYSDLTMLSYYMEMIREIFLIKIDGLMAQETGAIYLTLEK